MQKFALPNIHEIVEKIEIAKKYAFDAFKKTGIKLLKTDELSVKDLDENDHVESEKIQELPNAENPCNSIECTECTPRMDP